MVVLVLTACGTSRPQSVPLDHDFELTPGQSTRVETLTVRMERVANDSRCPIEVQCVWEGDATVVVALRSPPSAATVGELHTSHRFAQAAAYDGYVVRLIDLQPPRSHGVVLGGYRAVLRVSAAGPSR